MIKRAKDRPDIILIERLPDGSAVPRNENGQILTLVEWETLAETVRRFTWKEFVGEIELIDKPAGKQSPVLEEVSRAAPKPGYVYVIGSQKGPYKIGVSANPRSRLHALNVANHEELGLLQAIRFDDPYSIETALHEMLTEQHLSGEWFALDKDDLAFVGSFLEDLAHHE